MTKYIKNYVIRLKKSFFFIHKLYYLYYHLKWPLEALAVACKLFNFFNIKAFDFEFNFCKILTDSLKSLSAMFVFLVSFFALFTYHFTAKKVFLLGFVIKGTKCVLPQILTVLASKPTVSGVIILINKIDIEFP